MSLPGNVFPRPFSSLLMGIRVYVAPGDPDFLIEVQRAPDLGGGVPDAANAVSIAEVTANLDGRIVTDLLPLDGALRFYRARHIRSGWTNGDWTSWTAGA